MSTQRARHTATYSYPGLLFPETIIREISAPTFTAAATDAPDDGGHFGKDNWYAVTISSTLEKRFTADDGDEAWVKTGKPQIIAKCVVGDRYHYSEIEQTDANRILIANIQSNSTDGGYGVLTRCGNWQIASHYTAIVSPAEVPA